MTDLAAIVNRIREAESGPDGLNAFLSFSDPGPRSSGEGRERARKRDGEHDRERDGEREGTGALEGVPIAVKDNLVTDDLPTTCGSRLLDGYRSPFEATVVRKARRAGALIVGKTNLDEFGMGSSTENSAYGATFNPHDRSRVPGGSSGGSAAAVAAGYVPMALGSDTGGSVRQPAALCGVVGIKPTYGRVSRYGLVAFASSLDQVGTFGKTVRDASRLLEVVAGHDPRDATSVRAPVLELQKAATAAATGIVVGIPTEYLPDSLDSEVRGVTDQAIAALRQAGCEIRAVSLPNSDLAIPCYYVLAPAEASSNLARYDGVRYGLRKLGADALGMYEETRHMFGTEVKRRIMIGTYALSAGYHDEYYGAAQRARRLIARDFERVFDDGVDVLFTPTTPGPAFPLGERIDDPVRMYLSDVFTVTANLVGLPGISVPIGTVHGLPIGGQILAPWWAEERMVTVAAALERVLAGGAP